LVNVVGVQTALVSFIDLRFERIISTQVSLQLMQRVESLGIHNLGIVDKYQRILAHYSRDVDTVARIYQKNKTDPNLARDLPPISGKPVLL
jgi:dynein heavy chain